jgi:hypothetical protein
MNTTLPKKIRILQQKRRDTDTLQSLHANNKKQQGVINIEATTEEKAHQLTMLHTQKQLYINHSFLHIQG